MVTNEPEAPTVEAFIYDVAQNCELPTTLKG
jgi:hypothetical protein